MHIRAYLLSCPEREAMRAQTLTALQATDWGEAPTVEIDRSTALRRQERQEQTARLLLQRAVDDGAEIILFLEDDLVFNRHLRHNLRRWAPLRRVQPGDDFFGSLYNPNVHALARHDAQGYFVADPQAVYGSQAFVLARPTARHIVANWYTVEGMQDIKMSRLAAQVGPIVYHAPSLVQHVGVVSVWGGASHQAVDYDPVWINSEP